MFVRGVELHGQHFPLEEPQNLPGPVRNARERAAMRRIYKDKVKVRLVYMDETLADNYDAAYLSEFPPPNESQVTHLICRLRRWISRLVVGIMAFFVLLAGFYIWLAVF